VQRLLFSLFQKCESIGQLFYCSIIFYSDCGVLCLLVSVGPKKHE
jgi:hypothetical protein